MRNSQEFKKIIKQFLQVGLVVFVVAILLALGNISLYQQHFLKQQATLIDAICEKHPELEEEIIGILKDGTGNSDEGLERLQHYGIDEDSIQTLEVSKTLQRNVLIFYVLSFVILFCAVVLVYVWNLRSFYRKLKQMNQYIRDVLNDKITFHLEDFEEGTFSLLQNDVYKITNKLREQNENMIKDKKYLEETLSDISHQLKTPLTSMYMINNLLEEDHLDAKTKKEFLHKNELQLERIEWLVTSLLKLSRLESGMIQLKKEEVYVKDLIKSALEPLKIPIEVKMQKTIFKGNLKTKVCCDFNWTKEALVNIIKNAHEHTSEKGMLEFVWQDNPLYVAIIITDTGEGIAPDDLKHIFERFYKGKSSSKDSIGIGLNMAKQIIDRQQGDISVRSIVGQGTEFTIKFYKNRV